MHRVYCMLEDTKRTERPTLGEKAQTVRSPRREGPNTPFGRRCLGPPIAIKAIKGTNGSGGLRLVLGWPNLISAPHPCISA